MTTKHSYAQYAIEVIECKEDGCKNKITLDSGFKRKKTICDECTHKKRRQNIKDYYARKALEKKNKC